MYKHERCLINKTDYICKLYLQLHTNAHQYKLCMTVVYVKSTHLIFIISLIDYISYNIKAK